MVNNSLWNGGMWADNLKKERIQYANIREGQIQTFGAGMNWVSLKPLHEDEALEGRGVTKEVCNMGTLARSLSYSLSYIM